MGYDEAYKKTEDYFGAEPAPILKRYYHLIDKSKRVLDVGVGQGRNALFLARYGYAVGGIDPSKVAVEKVSSIAEKEKLPVRTYHCAFEEFVSPTDSYSAVLLLGLIQDLSRKAIDSLLERLKTWTQKGSLVFATAHTTADPSLPDVARKWKNAGKNSFVAKDGHIATYLEPDEILRLFTGYEIVHHWEGMGAKHRHGEGPLEQHAVVEALFRR